MFNLTSRLESKSSSKIENIVITMGTRFKHYNEQLASYVAFCHRALLFS
ncbi:hypothetical protein [Vibrio lentus]